MKKERLDILIVQRGLADSRAKAQAIIMAGEVRIGNQVMTKPGQSVLVDADIQVKQSLPYVSRGGLKLAGALDMFQITPAGKICADVGASTGGFTDVLLQRDARRVYALDVGYGQLAWKLRNDERVVVMERINVRYVSHLPEPIDWVTIDASFISLRLLLPVVIKWLNPAATIVVLVKPQFEAGKEQVGKKGIVRDRTVHHEVLEMVAQAADGLGLTVLGLTPSPITGATGNHEFLLYFGWQTTLPPIDVEAAIIAVLDEIHL